MGKVYPVLIDMSQVCDEMYSFTLSRDAIITLAYQGLMTTEVDIPEEWYTTPVEQADPYNMMQCDEQFYIEIKRYQLTNGHLSNWILCPMKTCTNCKVRHYGEYDISGKAVLKLLFDAYQNGFTAHDGFDNVF